MTNQNNTKNLDLKNINDITEIDLISIMVDSLQNSIYVYGGSDWYFYNTENNLFEDVSSEIFGILSDEYCKLITTPLQQRYEKLCKTKAKDLKRLNEEKKTLLKFSKINFKKKIVKEIIESSRKRFEVFDPLKQPNYLLPVLNKKCLNLKNGKIIERTKKHYFTFEVKANFKKGHVLQKTPEAEKFFSSLMSDDVQKIDFLKQILGCMLTGFSTKYIFSFYGSKGDNGKSVLMNKVMKHALGDYHRTITKDIILKRANKTNKGPSPEVLELLNGRVGIVSEINDGEHIDEEVFKLLSSGVDELSARNHHDRKMTKFINTCKVTFLLNKVFYLDTQDNALRFRIINLNFSAEFKQHPTKGQYQRDDKLVEFLTTPEGLAQVLSFLVEGSMKFIKQGEISSPILEEQKKNFLDLVDPVESYLKLIKFDEKFKKWYPRSFIREHFFKFLKQHKSKAPNSIISNLYERLSREAVTKKTVVGNSRGVLGYYGLSYIEEVEGGELFNNDSSEADFIDDSPDKLEIKNLNGHITELNDKIQELYKEIQKLKNKYEPDAPDTQESSDEEDSEEEEEVKKPIEDVTDFITTDTELQKPKRDNIKAVVYSESESDDEDDDASTICLKYDDSEYESEHDGDIILQDKHTAELKNLKLLVDPDFVDDKKVKKSKKSNLAFNVDKFITSKRPTQVEL